MEDRDRRLAMLQIDARSRQALDEFRPVLHRVLPDITAGFYAYLRQYPDLMKLFGSEAVVAHAAARQTEHWLSLFSGKFDDRYFESTRRIGHIHSKIGLEPRYYIAGYAFTLSRLYEVAAHTHANRLSPRKAQDALSDLLRALNQAVMLDMDLAISTYLDENEAKYAAELDTLAGTFDASVKGVVRSVAASAREMESIARSMEEVADETGQRAVVVAEGSKGASENVVAVVTASEELAGSISEISAQITKSAQIAAGAVDEAERTDREMKALVGVAHKIGEVINLISTIANQTNLLALNATIEAARAGDVGKGFAVVAAEVKSLATQTARATEDIRRQIEEVQTVSAHAAEAIRGINRTIGSMNAITTAISAAVEQQSSATQEISRSVGHAAAATDEVAANIDRVTRSAGETRQTAERVLRASASLTANCDSLESEVDSFLGKIRAA